MRSARLCGALQLVDELRIQLIARWEQPMLAERSAAVARDAQAATTDAGRGAALAPEVVRGSSGGSSILQPLALSLPSQRTLAAAAGAPAGASGGSSSNSSSRGCSACVLPCGMLHRTCLMLWSGSGVALGMWKLLPATVQALLGRYSMLPANVSCEHVCGGACLPKIL